VSRLLNACNITHVAPTEYVKGSMSKIDSEVMTLRNAYRTTIMDCKFFQGHMWDEVFPMVMCKLNAAIVKLGLNRGSLHYGQIIESSLPLLSDIEIFGPLEEEFSQVCTRFRDKMGRFMGKKKREKRIEDRQKIASQICVHELVMREVYPENDAIKVMAYTGPYRVLSTCSHGVELRDLKNGNTFSVAFEHVRKLTWEELCTLLPQQSEAKLMKALGVMEDSGAECRINTSEVGTYGEREEKSQFVPHKKFRDLKIGKLYAVALEFIPSKWRHYVQKASWRKERVARQKESRPRVPSIIRMFVDDDPFVTDKQQIWNEDQGIYEMIDRDGKRCYSFSTTEVERGKGRKDYRGKDFVSSFQSQETGALRLRLKREIDRGKENRTVGFSEVNVYFY
jgi:hypothetical protein